MSDNENTNASSAEHEQIRAKWPKFMIRPLAAIELGKAASAGDAKIVEMCLADGAAEAMNDKARAEALGHACTAESAETLRLLAGAFDVNVRETSGSTPLGHAASFGWKEGVEILLAAGADPNAPAGALGDRALGIAADRGWAEGVRLLLPVSNPAIANSQGTRPLSVAARVGSVECVEALLPATAAGAEADERLGSALRASVKASRGNSVQIARMLHGAISEEQKGWMAAKALGASIHEREAWSEAMEWLAERADLRALSDSETMGLAPMLASLGEKPARAGVLRAVCASAFFESEDGQKALTDALVKLANPSVSAPETTVDASIETLVTRLSRTRAGLDSATIAHLSWYPRLAGAIAKRVAQDESVALQGLLGATSPAAEPQTTERPAIAPRRV
jgi:hypothetical protein